MTTETVNTPTETPVNDDLDQFSAEFFGAATPEDTPAADPETPVEQTDTPVTDADETPAEADADDENEQVEGEDDSSRFKLGKKKQSAKERIQELVAKNKETEATYAAELAAVKAQLDAMKAAPEDKPTQATPALDPDTPNPDATNEDGTPKYKLGEFDPMYIRDLTRYTITQENKAAAEASRQAAEQASIADAQTQLVNEWAEKVTEAEKEIPDIRAKGAALESAFEGLDPRYGEYLVSTIMSLDNGPAVMAYLSDNLDEAKAIVAGGPNRATIALGRIDGQLTPAKKEVKRVSTAPEPPKSVNRGSSGRFDVADDTDDLDAFADKFFKRK